MYTDRSTSGGSRSDPQSALTVAFPSLPLLSQEDEQILIRRARDHGCTQSRDHVICANLRLVVYLAKRFTYSDVPIQDLIAAGNVALVYSVDKFDPDRGVRFATYAGECIRRAMIGLIRSQRARAAAPQSATFSLDGEDADIIRHVEDKSAPDPTRAIEMTEALGRVHSVLDRMDGSHALIVKLRFGLSGHPVHTIAEIARKIGRDARTVSFILQSAIANLRSSCAAAA